MMNDEAIKLEVNKIIKRWAWEKWLNLAISLVSVFLAFYIPGHQDMLHPAITEVPSVVYAVLGGVGIGHVWRNWSGSKELKLLKHVLKIN